MSLPLAADIERALGRLKSLHDGELGVVEVIECGRRAVPALHALLLEGQSSSIFHPGCRTVEALAALGAHDVLIEFLSAPRDVTDPVNRTGEQAVINAAARALVGCPDERAFPLLLELAKRQPLAGVIEALGSFRRPETIPCLIRGAVGRLQPPGGRSRASAPGGAGPPGAASGGIAPGAVGGVGDAIKPQGSPQRGSGVDADRRAIPTPVAALGSDSGRRSGGQRAQL